MAATRIGTLKSEDRAAVFATAKKLGLDPYEFGALIHQESGFNPNVWGGEGGKYRGLIQFGPGARQEVGLPNDQMTISQQLPYVEKYFQSRGYKPGMGIAKAYATVLGGNPGVSLHAKDSFGTSVASSLPRFMKGGELYKRAQETLGDLLTQPAAAPAVAPAKSATQQQQQSQAPVGGRNVVVNYFLNGLPTEEAVRNPFDFLSSYTKDRKLNFSDLLGMSNQASPADQLAKIIAQPVNYLQDPYFNQVV